MKLRTAKLGMYFVDFIQAYNHTSDMDNPAEFLKGPSAYTIIVLFLEQRNISQLQT